MPEQSLSIPMIVPLICKMAMTLAVGRSGSMVKCAFGYDKIIAAWRKRCAEAEAWKSKLGQLGHMIECR